LRKNKYILILVILLSYCSCGTKQNIAEQKQTSEFEKSFKYIRNDTIFSNDIMSYYPDLTNCGKLNFSYDNYIRPISVKDFNIGILSKTRLLNKIKDFDSLNRIEQTKVFDSIYNFSEYNIKQPSIAITDSICEIRLTFAKKINGIVAIKYEIIDENIDPRIYYKPRSGLYLLEFNRKNNIIDCGYILLSN